MKTTWPELNYKDWDKTLKTLHLWMQIVGKIRLKAMPWQNHSWHTTLYLSSRGFTTGSMPYGNGVFEIEFDFKKHQLLITSSFSNKVKMKLHSMTVADFYEELFEHLQEMGIEITIHQHPNELEDATPFKENKKNKTYDKKMAESFWRIAVLVHNVFQEFRGEYVGKCSPVHLFWGAFDLAVTRFSGRKAPLHQGFMPNMPKKVMQEAYSQEVYSCGFWPGNDAFPMAAFYAYSYPSPAAFALQKVEPEQAFWSAEMGEFFLKYEDVRASEHPAQTLMDFLQSTYLAAANTGEWDRTALEKTP